MGGKKTPAERENVKKKINKNEEKSIKIQRQWKKKKWKLYFRISDKVVNKQTVLISYVDS